LLSASHTEATVKFKEATKIKGIDAEPESATPVFNQCYLKNTNKYNKEHIVQFTFNQANIAI
jgi:hypothetical protein